MSATSLSAASCPHAVSMATTQLQPVSYRKHHALTGTPTLAASTTPSNQAAAPPSSQFKHTALWNGIVSHLKTTLIEINRRPNRLRKQQSRFVAASVGSMLMIKQNLMNTASSHGGASATTSQSPKSASSDLLSSHLDLCFSGSQCVDIVYNYLTSEEQIKNFQNEVTREKVTKVNTPASYLASFSPL